MNSGLDRPSMVERIWNGLSCMLLVKAALKIWQISHKIIICELLTSKNAVLQPSDLLQMDSNTNNF